MRTLAFVLIAAAAVLPACSLAASDFPALVQTASAECLELGEVIGAIPSPTPTAPPAPTVQMPPPQPTAASRPGEANSTPTPYPTPIPTPTVSVAPTQLPAAPSGDDMGDRFTLVGSWEPPYPGGFGSFAIFEREDGRYAFAQTGDGLRLHRLKADSPPQPQEALVGPFPEGVRIRGLDGEEDFLAIWIDAPGLRTALFYDVSELRSPCLVGSYPDLGRFFDLDGRTAYVERMVEVDDTSSDLVVIPDVTNSDHTVAIEGLAYQRDADYHHVKSIANDDLTVKDGIAYMNISEREGRERRNRFASLDIRDPESPVWLDEMDVYGAPIYIIGDRAYIMREDVSVRIVDISDPADMRVIGELPIEDAPGRGSSTAPREPGGLIVDGSRLYALLWGGDWGVVNWRLRIADISDPANPRELDRLEGAGWVPGMWLQENELVIADSYGFSFIDVSDPANLRETRRFPKGTAPRAVHLRDSFAYVFLFSGIFTLDLTNPGTPEQASFLYPGPIRNVREADSGFEANIHGVTESISLDISDPASPAITERHSDWIPMPKPSIGPYTYDAICSSLRVGGAGKRYIRLDEQDCTEEWQLAIHKEYVYVVGGGSLYILDASDPAAPILLARKVLASELEDVRQSAIQIDGQHAYVLHGGLWALDLSNPTQPREVAYYPTDARVIDVDGNRVALAGPQGAFTLLHSELE